MQHYEVTRMKVLVLRSYGDTLALSKLGKNYPHVTWCEVNVPEYDNVNKKVEALVDVVSLFDAVMCLDNFHIRTDSDKMLAIAVALGKKIYDEHDYPLDIKEDAKDMKELIVNTVINAVKKEGKVSEPF